MYNRSFYHIKFSHRIITVLINMDLEVHHRVELYQILCFLLGPWVLGSNIVNDHCMSQIQRVVDLVYLKVYNTFQFIKWAIPILPIAGNFSMQKVYALYLLQNSKYSMD